MSEEEKKQGDAFANLGEVLGAQQTVLEWLVTRAKETRSYLLVLLTLQLLLALAQLWHVWSHTCG
jgi:hypothetical protein